MKGLFSFKTLLLTLLGFVLLNNHEPDVSNTFRCNMPTHPDYAPLMALYNATDGANWNRNDGWGVDCDVCGWEGIICQSSRVRSIQLSGNNLDGSIPVEIENLDSLDRLSLSLNGITGDLPSSISNLSKLDYINLSSNELNSSFPIVLFGNTKLSEIHLAANSLNGNLPNEFTQLPNLERLHLSQNLFDGVIPSTLLSLQNLTNLDLANNLLEGSLDDGIANMTLLQDLRLSSNNFSGVLPPNIGLLGNLSVLDLSSNNFQGALPSSFYNLVNLVALRLQNNNISGNLLSDFGNLSKLESCYLDNNLFEGALPTSFSNLQSLEYFSIAANDFSGNLPQSLYGLNSLVSLNLSRNNFEGTISNELGNLDNLDYLNLSNNQFTGLFPNSILELELLTSLYIQYNEFSGVFPNNFGMLPSLRRISVFGNPFEGCYPDSYFNLCGILSATFGNHCTFENPSFSEFCAGAVCDNSLNLQVSSVVICEGESVTISAPTSYTAYQWSGSSTTSSSTDIIPTQSAYQHVTITNSRGCTKSDSVFIEVMPAASGNETAYMCDGSPVFVNGIEYNNPGQETQFIPRDGLCDSILNIEIIESFSTSGNFTTTVCFGGEANINGELLGAGNHSQTLTNISGCDSLLSIVVNELPAISSSLEFSACSGSTYNYEGSEFEIGTHTIEYQAANGCDSVLTLAIIEKSVTFGSISGLICGNSEIEINDITYASAGDFEQILTNVNGCDSVLAVTIEEGEESYAIIDGEFCEGSGYESNFETFYTEGPHEQILINSKGCDSILTIHLTELQNTESFLSYGICGDMDIEVNDQVYNTAGEYVQELTNTAGCDSTIHIIIGDISAKDTIINEFICDGGTYSAGGENFSAGGDYVIETSTLDGCDSLIYLNLSIVSGSDTTIMAITCEGQPYSFAGINLSQAGTYSDSIIIGECKALTTLILDVAEPSRSDVNWTICEGERFYLDGFFYEEEGTYETTVRNAQGCDSIVAYHLSIAPEYETRIDTFICEGETVYYDFQVYDRAGTFTKTKQSKSGCDSIVTLSIQAYDMSLQIFDFEVCSGDSIEFEGEKYAIGQHAGEYFDGNCNVAFELEVSEVEALEINFTYELCSTDSIEVLGQTYTSSGQYWIGKSSGECEYIEYLNIVEPAFENQINFLFICEGSSIEIGENSYSVPGEYWINSAESECNESSILALEVVNGEDLFITKTLELGTRIEIEGNFYSEAGEYEILVGENAECSSVLHLSIIVEECGGERSLDITLCNGDSYDFFGENILESGTYFHEKDLAISCDSFITLNISFESLSPFVITGSQLLCASESISLSGPLGYSYHWNTGSTEQFLEISQSGTYQLTISDQNGCSNSSLIVVDAFELPASAPKISKISPSECDSNDGRISIELENEANYQFSLDGIIWQESPLFIGLTNGFYQVLLADPSIACTQILSDGIELASDGVPAIQAIEVVDANDCQGVLGSLKIVAAKPNPNLVYSIDEGLNWQSAPEFKDLLPGIYNAQMKNTGSICVNNLSEPISIVNIGNLEAVAIIDQELACSTSADGQASINIIEGQGPFDYLWPAGENIQSVSDLSAGNYIVTISDANDCVIEVSFELAAADIAEITSSFVDTTICVGDILQYDNLNSDYDYYVFSNNQLYAEGNSFEIDRPGVYNIIIDNGSDCYEDKEITIDQIDLEEIGIDFLLSSQGVANVPVELVNISDPMPENGYWEFANDKIVVEELSRFSNTLIFPDTGVYEISYLAEIDGCLGSIQKSIIIYPDSTHMDNENPQVDINADRVEEFIVFPNPNDGKFQVDIRLSSALDCKLGIFNSQGGRVSARRLEGASDYSERFNLSTTNSGVYSVFLLLEGKVFKQQILILR